MQELNKLSDAFKQGGTFAENIRISIDDEGDNELRESMKAHGWVEQFPALVDEHDVTLVGHRRLKIAAELGIAPVIQKLVIGVGDEADAQRLRLAIVSNIGHKPMTKEDRQRIAKYLYGDYKWTEQRIADALSVSTATIGRDLSEFSHDEKIKPAKTTTNPKGAGRPKGRKKKPNKVPKEHYRQAEIAGLYDKGLTNSKIAVELGLGKRIVDDVIEHELIKRAAQADPIIVLESLPKSTQEKCEAWKRQTEKRLRIEIAEEERAKVRAWWDEAHLPRFDKELKDARAIIKARKGVFTDKEYKRLVAGLHPDRNTGSDAHELCILFQSKKLVLVSEKEFPVVSDWSLPKNWEEMMKRKAEVSAARKAKRAARKNGGIQPSS